MQRERRVNPDCVNASNRFHECTEHCVQGAHASEPRSPRTKLVVAAQNGERRKMDRGIVVAGRNVDPSCPNTSNPFHNCAEYCSPKYPLVRGQKEEKRSVGNGVKLDVNQKRKEEIDHTKGGNLDVTNQNGERCKEDQGNVVAERNVDPLPPNASNPYEQSAEHHSLRKLEVKRQNEKRPVENDVKTGDSRIVDPRCVNASNPYHVCAECCFQESKVMERAERSKAAQNVEKHKEVQGNAVAERNVDPLCPNASNPYHQCVEYCSPRKSEVKKQNSQKRSAKNAVKMEDNRMADPRCVNASNPYHVCVEYCFQKPKEIEHARGGKSAVSSPRERRGGLKTMEREGVHPNCVNASNPYHKCAEYCFEKMNQLT